MSELSVQSREQEEIDGVAMGSLLLSSVAVGAGYVAEVLHQPAIKYGLCALSAISYGVAMKRMFHASNNEAHHL